ncbi:hypothetical protein ABZ738_31395 [Micromonospora sp. NPDC047793]|uniref:hypothetical protein n=1 Tax=Micromonospora sp. NPDC047793 TaxID=3154342 RepID=UPI0033CE954A
MSDSTERHTGSRGFEDQTNWPEFGRRLQQIQAKLVHGDGEPLLSGDDFYGEALRRLLTSGSGWMSRAEHEWHLRGLHVFNGSAAQTARRQAREARGRYAISARAIRAELAAWLREAGANERIVPSRYRRDGVLLAADWIDPATAASPYPQPEQDQEAMPSRTGDFRWSRVLEALRAAGEQDGEQAAAWWAQYTIGGSSRDDVTALARAVLAGIDACDPAVLDGLPAFDLAGYDAERYRVHAPHDAPKWDDLSDADQAAAIDATRDGFTTAVEDGVAARCAALLDSDTPPTE